MAITQNNRDVYKCCTLKVNEQDTATLTARKRKKHKGAQVAQLSQKDRATEWVSYGKKWKTETGRQYFTDIIGLSSTTVT